MKKHITKWKGMSFTARLCIIMLTAFVLSLIPLIHIGLYSHPMADDYIYGHVAHQAWKHSRSLIAVIGAAIENVKDYYFTWQGTYSSIFMMSLQPAVISERLYPLTCVVMLGMLIGSHFFFFRALYTKFLKFSRSAWVVITLSFLFLSIQVLDTPAQAFYWYNGALHYVFMHSCMIFLMGSLLLLLKADSRRSRIFYLILSGFFAIVTGGANFVTALVTPVIICFILLFCVYKKEKKGYRLLLPFLLSIAGLIINVAAPGNAVRMADQAAPMSAPEAIYYSFLYAIEGIGSWTTLYLIFILILLIPVLIPELDRTDFDFPYPGILAGISYCIIAVTYTPSLYSMGHVIIYGRTLNIMQMTYYLLLFLNLTYTLGWLIKKLRSYDSQNSLPQIFSQLKKRYLRSFSCFMAAFLLGLMLFSDKNNVASFSAIHSLKEGYAQSYHQESLHRLALLSMEGVDEVWVPNYSVRAPLLDLGEDITTDPDNWKNLAVARWFEKEKVYISYVY